MCPVVTVGVEEDAQARVCVCTHVHMYGWVSVHVCELSASGHLIAGHASILGAWQSAWCMNDKMSVQA